MLRRLIPLMFVLSAVAQLPVAPHTAQDNFRISGTVVNALTGQPLKKIQVAAGPVGSPGGDKTITDSQGHFAFDGLAKGKFWLVAQGRGFPRQTFDEHEGFSSAIAVGNRDIPSEGIVFRLRPGASISGVITDDFNELVRNAGVTLFRTIIENGKQTTKMAQRANSDDQGRYHFSHLPAGSYFIAVSTRPWYAQNNPHFQVVFTSTTASDGTTTSTRKEVIPPSGSDSDPLDVAYPTTFYAGTTDSSSATPIVVKPGDQASADVTLSAVPAVHLRLPQTGQGDNTFYTLSQHVFGSVLPINAPNFRTNGELEITGVVPGQFTLEAQANGPKPTRSSEEINVLENGEIASVKLSPSLAVRGVVTMDGKPVSPGVFVHLRGQGKSYGNRVLEKGKFEIAEPVTAGSYQVLLYGITGGAVVSSITRDALPAVDGNRIELNGPGPVQLDIKLSRGLGRIEGLAVRNGKPFPGAMVILVPDDLERHLSFVRRDQSDGDGTFLLGNAAPGKYKIVAIRNGWDIEWSNPAVLKPFLKAAAPLQVDANQKYSVTVKVQ